MAVATRVNERIERLRPSLEEPLLVTAGVNVRYLTGLASSNAALFSRPHPQKAPRHR